MPQVAYNNSPKISDLVSFDLATTDASGTPIVPYEVNAATIYFLERSFWKEGRFELTQEIEGQTVRTSYSQAVPVATFGSSDNPVWLSTDTGSAFVTYQDYDESGAPQTGHFQLLWEPILAKEGDYFLCYSWTPVVLGEVLSDRLDFYLHGDTQQTTSIPTHFADPEKYGTLLDLYLPDMFRMMIAPSDLSPDVIDKFNQVVAAGFTGLENLSNQIMDLLDANATHESILPYLAAMLGKTLRTQDVTLWRRQIKQAVPLYKRKGTLGGLRDALAESQATLVSVTKYWQVVSKYTWQDSFTYGDDFTLSKLAVLPVDVNYGVFLRRSGETSYSQFASNYATLANALGVTTAAWVGDSQTPAVSMQEGDRLLLRYTVVTPPSVGEQTIETYVQGVPLADDRDETEVTHPPKNWNVRLIADDDSLLSSVCPSLNPFAEPVIYGQVRTEFPFSENIYNMETYNGSTRDSTDPCHLDKDFLDACPCCASSKVSVDVEIESLSNDRIVEVADVIRDCIPMHAQIHTINYSGAFNEFMSSPEERVEALVTSRTEENVLFVQDSFNRVTNDGASDALALKRNMLASASVAASASNGVGTNSAVVMFSHGIRFDSLGIKAGGNLLQILTGPNAGDWSVSASGRSVIDVEPGASVGWPLSASAFSYHLSNLLYSDATASIYQDDLTVFSDASTDFQTYGTTSGETGTAWLIQVTAGPHAGTYTIDKINPDGGLVLGGWSGSGASGLSYSLKSGPTVVASSTSGVAAVTSRGRVVVPLIQAELGIIQGDYCLYSGTHYAIAGFAKRASGATTDSFYVLGYSGGTVVGSASVKVYRRLIDSGVGYLDVRGMVLTTATDYEASLGIANGSNPIANPLENDLFIENFLVLIGTNYYQITTWDGEEITLAGPMLNWGMTGTAGVSYSIVKFTKTSPIYTEDGVRFDRLDRRNDEVVISSTETSMGMAMRAAALNSGGKGLGDSVAAAEKIWMKIEYDK